MTTANSTSVPAIGSGTNGRQPPGRRQVLAGGAALGAAFLPFGAGAPTDTSSRRAGAPEAAAPLAGAAQAGARPAGDAAGLWADRPRGGPTNADWAALRAHLSTRELSRPGERTYPLDKLLYDPRFDSLRPAGIAYCANPGDVATCLSFATKFGLNPRARAGGHSYAGWSSATGGLVVDVTRIDHFALGHGNVRVGAGIDMINFYRNLAAKGLAVPGGSCPTVGLAGLALGGGIGVLARQFGLTSDSLESVQIVIADGSVVNCDAKHHSDLLWACRGGGGGNFGIATSFTMRTRHLRQLVLFFLSWPWSKAGRVLAAWQSWAPHGPDALWANLHLTTPFGGAPTVTVGGTYIGSVAGAERVLGRLYARVGSRPSSAFVREEPYLDAMLTEAGCSGKTVQQCNTRPHGELPRVPSFAKSDFFTRRLSGFAVGRLLLHMEAASRIHGTAGGEAAVALDALGGAVNRVHPAATAFVHRDSLFVAQYSTSWRSPGDPKGVARQHEWLRSVYGTLHPRASGQAYQNYVDPDLTDWRRAYYRQNYPRLSRVKGRYDPHMLFRFPQAITPPGR